MPELVNPMPKRVKPMGGGRNAMPLEPPPTPPRYVGSTWRPNAPGFPDTPHIPNSAKDQQR